jgi:hypothetical protein
MLIDRWVVDPMRFETRGNSPRSAMRNAATVGRNNESALDFIAANHHWSKQTNFCSDRESPDPGRICALPCVGLNERTASTAS